MARIRRLGLFLAALAACAGLGWEVGRLAGPGLPAPAISVPVVPGGHSH